MVGSRRPALCAMFVNFARNGSPDGLPRGVALTDRVATPCGWRRAAKGSVASAIRERLVKRAALDMVLSVSGTAILTSETKEYCMEAGEEAGCNFAEQNLM